MFSKLSPSFARKAGHQQLTGSDADEKDRIIAGVQYSVRYIGSTEVAGANGTGSGKTEKPVAKIFEQQSKKNDGKTQKKMVLTLCSKSLSVSEEACGKLVANFPISKITFCNIDSFYEKAFVFVARDRPESAFKAFVFTCENKAKARELFKALSLAFMINYESYQASLIRGAPTSGLPAVESKETCFDGMAGETATDPQVSDENSEQLHLNVVSLSPKYPYVAVSNGSQPPQETQTPKPLEPMQNKNLLRVIADCRLRGASDLPPFAGRTSASAITSLPENRPSLLNPVSLKIGDEMEEEFTEFAELRSKCRSSSALTVRNHPGSLSQGVHLFDSAPNVWGSFQNHTCLPIH